MASTSDAPEASPATSFDTTKSSLTYDDKDGLGNDVQYRLNAKVDFIIPESSGSHINIQYQSELPTGNGFVSGTTSNSYSRFSSYLSLELLRRSCYNWFDNLGLGREDKVEWINSIKGKLTFVFDEERKATVPQKMDNLRSTSLCSILVDNTKNVNLEWTENGFVIYVPILLGVKDDAPTSLSEVSGYGRYFVDFDKGRNAHEVLMHMSIPDALDNLVFICKRGKVSKIMTMSFIESKYNPPLRILREKYNTSFDFSGKDIRQFKLHSLFEFLNVSENADLTQETSLGDEVILSTVERVGIKDYYVRLSQFIDLSVTEQTQREPSTLDEIPTDDSLGTQFKRIRGEAVSTPHTHEVLKTASSKLYNKEKRKPSYSQHPDITLECQDDISLTSGGSFQGNQDLCDDWGDDVPGQTEQSPGLDESDGVRGTQSSEMHGEDSGENGAEHGGLNDSRDNDNVNLDLPILLRNKGLIGSFYFNAPSSSFNLYEQSAKQAYLDMRQDIAKAFEVATNKVYVDDNFVLLNITEEKFQQAPSVIKQCFTKKSEFSLDPSGRSYRKIRMSLNSILDQYSDAHGLYLGQKLLSYYITPFLDDQHITNHIETYEVTRGLITNEVSVEEVNLVTKLMTKCGSKLYVPHTKRYQKARQILANSGASDTTDVVGQLISSYCGSTFWENLDCPSPEVLVERANGGILNDIKVEITIKSISSHFQQGNVDEAIMSLVQLDESNSLNKTFDFMRKERCAREVERETLEDIVSRLTAEHSKAIQGGVASTVTHISSKLAEIEKTLSVLSANLLTSRNNEFSVKLTPKQKRERIDSELSARSLSPTGKLPVAKVENVDSKASRKKLDFRETIRDDLSWEECMLSYFGGEWGDIFICSEQELKTILTLDEVKYISKNKIRIRSFASRRKQKLHIVEYIKSIT